MINRDLIIRVEQKTTFETEKRKTEKQKKSCGHENQLQLTICFADHAPILFVCPWNGGGLSKLTNAKIST